MSGALVPALPNEHRTWPGNSPVPGWREDDGKKFIRVADKGYYLQVLNQLLLPQITIVIMACKYDQL